jgi:predicted TIM-barrel fold metal-dependent hydrolase
MDKSRGMGRNGIWLGGQLSERPSRIFHNHIKVVPYPEDDIVGLADRLGTADSLVMGSDWPHAEGMAEPADFYRNVEGLGDINRRKFLRDNALALLTP